MKRVCLLLPFLLFVPACSSPPPPPSDTTGDEEKPYGGLLLTDFDSAFAQELFTWDPVRNIRITLTPGNAERVLSYEFQAKHRTGRDAVVFASRSKKVEAGRYAFVRMKEDIQGFDYVAKKGEDFIFDGTNWRQARYVVHPGPALDTRLEVDPGASLQIVAEGQVTVAGRATGPTGFQTDKDSPSYGRLSISVGGQPIGGGPSFTGRAGAAGTLRFSISPGPGGQPGTGYYTVTIRDVR